MAISKISQYILWGFMGVSLVLVESRCGGAELLLAMRVHQAIGPTFVATPKLFIE